MEKGCLQYDEAKSVSCQFCENSSEIKCRCLNCELILCCFCDKQIHSKIKSEVVHKRIDVKNNGKDDEIEMIIKGNLLNMKCKIHKSKSCVIYCKDCETLLCSSCIIDCHQQHKLVELEEEFQRQRNYLSDLNNVIQNRLTITKRREETMDRNLLKAQENHMNVKSVILNYENELTERINARADMIDNKLTHQWNLRENNLQKKLFIAHQNKTDSEGIQNMIRELTLSDQAKDIVEKCSLIKSILPSTDIYLSQTKTQPIIFRDIDAVNVGSLDIPVGIVHDSVSFDIIGTYKSKMNCITYIYSLNDSELLLYNSQTQILQVLTCSGANLKKFFQKNIFASDIAVTNDGRIYLLSNFSFKCLNYRTKRITDFKSPIEYVERRLFCIHVHQQDQILIGGINFVNEEFYADYHNVGDDYGSSAENYVDDDSDDNTYDDCDDYDESGNDCDQDKHAIRFYSSDDDSDHDSDYSNYEVDNDHDSRNENDNDHDSNYEVDNDHDMRNENDNDHDSQDTIENDINCEHSYIDDNKLIDNDSNNSSDDEVNNEYLYDTNDYSEDEFYRDQYDSYDDLRQRQKGKICIGEIHIVNPDGFDRMETGFVPHRIATTSNHNLCMIDKKDGEGRILCLNTAQEIIWAYSGCKYHGNRYFNHQQLAVSHLNFVFVLDIFGSIHLLNPNGELLTCVFLRDKINCNVSSISFDSRGQMWIACQNESGATGATIYCLRLD